MYGIALTAIEDYEEGCERYGRNKKYSNYPCGGHQVES
jgi:hypothetical protein